MPGGWRGNLFTPSPHVSSPFLLVRRIPSAMRCDRWPPNLPELSALHHVEVVACRAPPPGRLGEHIAQPTRHGSRPLGGGQRGFFRFGKRNAGQVDPEGDGTRPHPDIMRLY